MLKILKVCAFLLQCSPRPFFVGIPPFKFGASPSLRRCLWPASEIPPPPAAACSYSSSPSLCAWLELELCGQKKEEAKGTERRRREWEEGGEKE